MLFLIVILPFFGFISAGLFGRFLGKGACYITFLNTFSSFLLSFYCGYKIINTGLTYKTVIFPWIYSDFLEISWGFQFDSLTFVMLFIITCISSFVHLYSLEYMEADPHLTRFMSYLSLFTFFMLILVTSNNLLQMFVGWEGVGLSSYLLINFWYTRIQANKSAIKAMLVNRIGDFAILLGIFLTYYLFNSLDYDIIFVLVNKVSLIKFSLFTFEFSYLDLIAFLFFIGAMGKSAQIGLHVWLPDAMEGPTPVSALIHAATMVTAGVFLIVRCSFLFELTPNILNLILVIGSLTTFFSSTIGLFQNDIKKIIAYSTCSQLGYMIFSCGLSSYDVAVFHLSNHAFFKALLFLGAGSIIHAINDEQDLRRMGGLRTRLYLSYTAMLIGSLALGGFPFFSGFYSKDAIIEAAYIKYSVFSHFAFFLGAFSVFSTAFYSQRLLHLAFLSQPAGYRQSILGAQEPGFFMMTPLIILSFFSIFIGYFSKDLFIGFGTNFWKNSIFILPNNASLLDIEFLSLAPKLFPLFLSFFGSFVAIYIYSHETTFFYNMKNTQKFKEVYSFLNKRWYFDRIYNQLIVQSIFYYCFNFVYKEIDRGFIEQVGPLSIIQSIKLISNKFKYADNTTLFHLVFFFLLVFTIFPFFSLTVYYFSFFFEILLLLFIVSFFS